MNTDIKRLYYLLLVKGYKVISCTKYPLNHYEIIVEGEIKREPLRVKRISIGRTTKSRVTTEHIRIVLKPKEK